MLRVVCEAGVGIRLRCSIRRAGRCADAGYRAFTRKYFTVAAAVGSTTSQDRRRNSNTISAGQTQGEVWNRSACQMRRCAAFHVWLMKLECGSGIERDGSGCHI